MKNLVALVLSALALIFARPPASAQVNFYQGKTLTFIVNMAAGDANDLWARALARSLVKYIPGNPNIIAQNMAGGGSMISANYLYSVAKPDGLTIGQTSASLYFQQLTGRREVQFDWRKFSWIGSAGLVEALLMMRADAPYKSIEDIRTAGDPPKCSATAPGSSGHISLRVLEDVLGAKVRIVTGYKSGSDQDLAIERGEVQCRSVSSASFLAREPFISWQKKGFIRILMQSGRKRNPKLGDVPTIYELMTRYQTAEAKRRLAAVLLGADQFGQYLAVAPPATPVERVKILRDAYTRALKDPDLIEEARKRNWSMEHISGEELQTLAKEVIDQPPQLIDRVKELLGGS
ncbi:MAG TPA: tripartite tricarboxylate transporter substrate-binding protein [Candidatus Limnocylindrales bacterium]|nr:tripartite tricarboxylate transporter substrate-binding protein [Candidatus Limnocylindrales bacterium]